MDPRETPEYHLHRVLSNLHQIDLGWLEPDERRRVELVTDLVEQVMSQRATGEETASR